MFNLSSETDEQPALSTTHGENRKLTKRETKKINKNGEVSGKSA